MTADFVEYEFKPWGYVWDFYVDPQVGLAYNIGHNVKSIFVNAGYFLPLLSMIDGNYYGKLEGFRVKLGITF